MKEPQHHGSRNPGTRETSSKGDGNGFSSAAFLADIIRTRECRVAIDTMLSHAMGKRGGRKSVKGLLIRAIRWYLERKLSRSEGTLEQKGLHLLFEDSGFIQNAGNKLPELANSTFDILNSINTGIANLPIEKKKALLDALFVNVDTGKIGAMLTTLARSIDEIHKDSPTFFAERLEPALTKWLENTDFGELKDLFDHSTADIIASVKKANEVMWRYPAKSMLLMTFFPGFINIAVHFLADTLGRNNQMAPDVLTDALLAMLGDIDGRAAGDLVNEATEFLRKFHTGSALIGEPGTPQFPVALTAILEDFIGAIDPKLFWKARVAISEEKENVDNVMVEVLREKPELLMLQLSQSTLLRNARIRAMVRKLSLMEELPEEGVAEAVAQGLSAWNAYDVAEVVNITSRLLNRIRDIRPEVIAALATEFVNSLDLDELDNTLKWLITDLGKTLRPLFRMLLPSLVKEFCGFFTPEDDGYDEAIQEARDTFCRFLMKEETKG